MDKLTIPAHKVDAVRAEIDKLVRRATRLGCEAPRLTVGAPRTEKRRDYITGTTRTSRVVDIEIEGSPVKLGDYTLLAHMEAEEGGNLIFTVPGQEVDERFRTSGPHCHHCNTTRPRKHLYVLRDAQGEQVQVGRSCLRDFLGVDPARVALAATWDSALSGIEEDSWGGGYGGYSASLRDIVAYTSAVIEHEGGYVSGAAAQADPRAIATSTLVSDAMYPNSRNEDSVRYARAIRALLTEERTAEADRCLAWVTDEWKASSDYAWNLKVIAQQEILTNWRALGFALSMYPTWQRELGRLKEMEIKRKQEAEQGKDSSFRGTVGERLKGIPVTCTTARFIKSGDWGDTYLYKFTAENGDVMTWFSQPRGIHQGDEGLLTGTIKEHRVYRDAKETALTRCKWESTKSATEG